MTDSRALKELIKSKGLKLKYVAEYLGLSSYGFSKKLNNEQEFKTTPIWIRPMENRSQYRMCTWYGVVRHYRTVKHF